MEYSFYFWDFFLTLHLPLKLLRTGLVIAVLLVAIIVALYSYENLFAARTNTRSLVWLSAAPYPLQNSGVYGVGGEQCLGLSNRIYCIGGQDTTNRPQNAVFVSSILSSSSNITAWSPGSNSYPAPTNGESCVESSKYVYCIGGSNDTRGDDSLASYYSTLNSNGVLGPFLQTTSFPVPVDSQSCVSFASYIYCVGGNNETNGAAVNSTSSSSVWFAKLSSGGIGPWLETTSYPSSAYFPSCTADSGNGYIYCVGGLDSAGDALKDSYYARLSSSGVGAWNATSPYPLALSAQYCFVFSGNIYCIGGQGPTENSYTSAVYYANVSASGIGTWKQAPSYPQSLTTDCAVAQGVVYCVGGFEENAQGETANVYYASLSALI